MSLARILNQVAYVASVTGIDAYGKPTYGTPVERRVRVEMRRTLVTNARGEEVMANHRLWCTEVVNITDRIWLPGLSTSSSEAADLPLAVSSAGDFAGTRTLYKVEI